MFEYRASVDRVIDGDTIDFTVDLGFHVSVLVRACLARIDAPEMSAPGGQASKTAVLGAAPPGTRCTLKTAKGDRYGRWIAEVVLPDGRNLSDFLLSNNFAKTYS